MQGQKDILELVAFLFNQVNELKHVIEELKSENEELRSKLSDYETKKNSTIYRNQPSVVADILTELNKWMDDKGYKTLDDFRGKLSRKKLKDPFAYQRAQYVDILMKSETIFKKYPMV